MIKRAVSFTSWTIAATVLSGLALALAHRDTLTTLLATKDSSDQAAAIATPSPSPRLSPYPEPSAKPGTRVYLNYEQWVDLVGREAKVAAEDRPARLTILAGDSLSLWFPQELLPSGFSWLNQGISGDASDGLLRRLKLFDATQPEMILVMIGINDLSQGLRRETVVANHREILSHLKTVHPQARVVVQSILPHAADRALQSPTPPPWAERLISTPNSDIRELNQELAIVAKEESVDFLDLHPFFTDPQGEMQAELTTDGLHLNRRGYAVWRSQLQEFQQRSSRPVSVPSH